MGRLCRFWWAEMDSNHRRRKSTDLQSVAFGRSAIYPSGAGGRNRTNNRLITSQMLYHWATPASVSPALAGAWCRGAESNHRHWDFQSHALPTELPRHTLFFCEKITKKIWRPRTGSNRRPPAWQAGALTNWATGPNIFKLLVGLHGLEPRTNRLWAGRSNQLS